MPAVISEYNMSSPYYGAILNAEPVSVTGANAGGIAAGALIAPLYYPSRVDRQRTRRLIILGIQLYKVQYAVFAGVYESIRLGIHKS